MTPIDKAHVARQDATMSDQSPIDITKPVGKTNIIGQRSWRIPLGIPISFSIAETFLVGKTLWQRDNPLLRISLISSLFSGLEFLFLSARPLNRKKVMASSPSLYRYPLLLVNPSLSARPTSVRETSQRATLSSFYISKTLSGQKDVTARLRIPWRAHFLCQGDLRQSRRPCGDITLFSLSLFPFGETLPGR